MMRNGEQRAAPTTTVTVARVRLFQPTQRPTHRRGEWMQTSWGRCRVSGRLGQRHADLIEAILFHAEKSRDTDDGGRELLVDPARVRQSLSANSYSGGQIKMLAEDLTAAVVEIQAGVGEWALGHLVDHIINTENIERKNPLTGKMRPLWIVRLGLPLVRLLHRDLALWYNPAPIAALRHGISQAVARHVLTHRRRDDSRSLDGLIHAVAGNLPAKQMVDRRREIAADAQALASMGIKYHTKKIRQSPDDAEYPPDDAEYPPDDAEHPPGNTEHPPDS